MRAEHAPEPQPERTYAPDPEPGRYYTEVKKLGNGAEVHTRHKIAAPPPPSPVQKFYDTLQLPDTASLIEMKKAYRKLAMKNNPDRGGDRDTYIAVRLAYDVLRAVKEQEMAEAEDYAEIEVTLERGNRGLGITMEQTGHGSGFYTQRVIVKSVVAGKPAALCGQIQAQDILVGVDGHDVRGIPFDNVLTFIRGTGSPTIDFALLRKKKDVVAVPVAEAPLGGAGAADADELSAAAAAPACPAPPPTAAAPDAGSSDGNSSLDEEEVQEEFDIKATEGAAKAEAAQPCSSLIQDAPSSSAVATALLSPSASTSAAGGATSAAATTAGGVHNPFSHENYDAAVPRDYVRKLSQSQGAEAQAPTDVVLAPQPPVQPPATTTTNSNSPPKRTTRE